MFIKKVGGVLLLLVLFLAGCTEQEKEVKAVEDPNIETIKKYLEIEYNGPNEDYIRFMDELLKEMTNSDISEEQMKAANDRYNQYFYDTFGTFIEEEALQKLILTVHVFTYHEKAHENGYTFKTDQIQIKQQDGFKQNYDYTVDLTYEKNGEKKTATMIGFVTMAENGKISGIRPISDSGLYVEMMEASREGRDNGFLARGILQIQFGRTDHKLNKLWAGSAHPLDNQALVQYLDKKYSSYFSKEGLEDFIASFGFIYPAIAAENGYELSVGEIEVVQDKNNPTSYNTSVIVHYQREGDEEKTATVKGVATIKDGPVEKLDILDDGGLKEALKNDYQVPFKISEMKSVVLKLNNSALGKTLTGVRYEVLLWSQKELSNEERLSFEFEVVTDSTILNESLGPIQPLVLSDTRDGYLYTLSIDTMYRDYSKEELERLSKERDFQIHLNNKGEVYVVEPL